MVHHPKKVVTPCLQSLELCGRFRQAMSDNWLLDESFAESLALQDVSHGCGEGDACLSGGAECDEEALVVELG